MAYQCAVQILGLTKDNPNTKREGKSNHVARADKIIKEMMKERASKSQTLDKNLSFKNLYFSKYDTDSGAEITEEMIEEFETMEVPVTGKDGVTRYRKPRSDTEFAISAIVHPPSEVTEQWTDEQKAQFFKDAYEVLAEIDPIFCNDNLRCYAVHRDEAGEHIHTVHMAIRDNGSIGASYTSSVKWLQNLNREFPRRMNERGYDIEDVEQIDYTALNMKTEEISDPEERAKAERKKEEAQTLMKRKRSEKRAGGKSVNEYAAEQAGRALEMARESQNETAILEQEARQAQTAIKAEYKTAQAVRAEAEEDAQTIRAKAEEDAQTIRAKADAEAQEIRNGAREEAETAKREAEAERQKASRAEQETAIAKQETERAKREAEEARRAVLEAQAQESASREQNAQYEAEIEAKKVQIAALDTELNGDEQNEGAIKKKKRLTEENQKLEEDIAEQQRIFNEIIEKIARRTGAGNGRRITEMAETARKVQQTDVERECGYQYGG